MSGVTRRVRARMGPGRRIVRFVIRFLRRLARVIFIVAAAMGPRLPPPPPPPPPAIEQIDPGGHLLDEE